MPQTEAMQLLTALQDQTSSVLCIKIMVSSRRSLPPNGWPTMLSCTTQELCSQWPRQHIQQWHKRPRHETADTLGRQEGTQRGRQADSKDRSCKAGSQVFYQAAEMSDRALWRSRPAPKWKKILPTAYMPVLEHRPLLKHLSPQTERINVSILMGCSTCTA